MEGNINYWNKVIRILRHEFWKSGQDQTWSGLSGWGVIFRVEFGKSGQDHTRSGMAGWGVIFRDECWKSGQDQTRSGLAGWGVIFRDEFGNLDMIRHDRGGLAECGFSVTNLGNLGRIDDEGTHAPAGRSHVAAAREVSMPAPQGPRRRAA